MYPSSARKDKYNGTANDYGLLGSSWIEVIQLCRVQPAFVDRWRAAEAGKLSGGCCSMKCCWMVTDWTHWIADQRGQLSQEENSKRLLGSLRRRCPNIMCH